MKKFDKQIKVAVMGCEVNGPGEAKDADIGIAAGVGRGIIFRKGCGRGESTALSASNAGDDSTRRGGHR